jgi:hypothetical protein
LITIRLIQTHGTLPFQPVSSPMGSMDFHSGTGV